MRGKRARIVATSAIFASAAALAFAIASMAGSTPSSPTPTLRRNPSPEGARPSGTTGSSTSKSQTVPTQTLFAPCNSPTPCNQDALSAVVEGATKIAGHRYYTSGEIDTEANTATVYLVSRTPQSIIDEIEAKYPNIQVFHSAPHNLRSLNALSDRVAADVPALKALGVVVRSISKAADGRLKIGVANNVDVATKILKSRYGADWVRAVKGDEIILF